jgi:hypothetical protein
VIFVLTVKEREKMMQTAPVVQLCVQLQRDAFANSENARNMSIAGSLVEVLKILMCVVVVPLFAQVPLVSTVTLMETDAQML